MTFTLGKYSHFQKVVTSARGRILGSTIFAGQGGEKEANVNTVQWNNFKTVIVLQDP